MKHSSAFGKSFRGYKKEEVNRYIAQTAQEFARREDAWETEKGKLLRAEDGIRAELEKAESQRDELACQVYAAEKRAEETERISLELKSTIAGLAARVAEAEAARADTDTDALYRRLDEKVEQIMSAANENAGQIVKDAIRYGDEIIAGAEKKAAQILLDATAHSEASYYDDVVHFASQIRDSMNRLLSEIDAKKSVMSQKLEEIREPRDAARAEGKPSACAALDEKLEHLFQSAMDSIADLSKKP